MKHTYTVKKQRFGMSLSFSHDPEARKITGPNAKSVLSFLAHWDGIGIIYGTQTAPAPDPLGSSRDMAIMLFDWGWELPDELATLLPPAQDIPEGAVA